MNLLYIYIYIYIYVCVFKYYLLFVLYFLLYKHFTTLVSICDNYKDEIENNIISKVMNINLKNNVSSM